MIRVIDIKGCKTCKKVLLYINRNENGEDFIQLVAWHDSKDGKLIQLDQINFTDLDGKTNILMLQRLIYDFSELSANEFVNSFKF